MSMKANGMGNTLRKLRKQFTFFYIYVYRWMMAFEMNFADG